MTLDSLDGLRGWRICGQRVLAIVGLDPRHRSRRIDGTVTCRATLRSLKHAAPSTTPTAEKPALADEQRAALLRLLADRLRDPDGLDRATLARIEQLTGDGH